MIKTLYLFSYAQFICAILIKSGRRIKKKKATINLVAH